MRPCWAWRGRGVRRDRGHAHDHVDFESGRGRSAPRGTQGAGRQPERPGGHGQPAAGGRDRPGPAAPRRHGAGPGLYEGLLPLAERYDVAIAGGDTNSWDGPLAVSVTLLGPLTPRGPLLRGGAGPGDRVVVTGSFGGSILGRHFDFEPAWSRPCAYTPLPSFTRASMPATACRSIWPTWPRRAAAARYSTPARSRSAEAARRLAAQCGRRLDAAGPRPGGRRGFRVDPGGAAAEAARMLAEQPLGVPLTGSADSWRSPGLWQRERPGRPPAAEPRGWQHEFD